MSTNPEAPRLNLEYFRKAAKALLKAAQSGEPSALERLRAIPANLTKRPLCTKHNWRLPESKGSRAGRDSGPACRNRPWIFEGWRRSLSSAHWKICGGLRRCWRGIRKSPAPMFTARWWWAMCAEWSMRWPRTRISRRQKAAHAHGSRCCTFVSRVSRMASRAVPATWSKRRVCCSATAPIQMLAMWMRDGPTPRFPACTQPAV